MVISHGKWHRGEPTTELRSDNSTERMPNTAFRKRWSGGLIDILEFKMSGRVSGSKHLR